MERNVRDGEGTENWFSVCERKGRRNERRNEVCPFL